MPVVFNASPEAVVEIPQKHRDLIGAFLTEWLEWVQAGAPEQGGGARSYLSRHTGLCASFDEFLAVHSAGAMSTRERIARQFKKLFPKPSHKFQLPQFPFDETPRNFWDDKGAGTLWQNPRRSNRFSESIAVLTVAKGLGE